LEGRAGGRVGGPAFGRPRTRPAPKAHAERPRWTATPNGLDEQWRGVPWRSSGFTLARRPPWFGRALVRHGRCRLTMRKRPNKSMRSSDSRTACPFVSTLPPLSSSLPTREASGDQPTCTDLTEHRVGGELFTTDAGTAANRDRCTDRGPLLATVRASGSRPSPDSPWLVRQRTDTSSKSDAQVTGQLWPASNVGLARVH
jgi:hypothetical protein